MLPLVWDVFCKYEAVNYPKNGEEAFWNAIHSEYADGIRYIPMVLERT